MGRWKMLTEPDRVRCEQMIAYGHSHEHIAATLHCHVAVVDEVRLRMDMINASPDGQITRHKKAS